MEGKHLHRKDRQGCGHARGIARGRSTLLFQEETKEFSVVTHYLMKGGRKQRERERQQS